MNRYRYIYHDVSLQDIFNFVESNTSIIQNWVEKYSIEIKENFNDLLIIKDSLNLSIDTTWADKQNEQKNIQIPN
jgi:hypothetical protein